MLVAPPVWGPLLVAERSPGGRRGYVAFNAVVGSACSAFALGIAPPGPPWRLGADAVRPAERRRRRPRRGRGGAASAGCAARSPRAAPGWGGCAGPRRRSAARADRRSARAPGR